MAVQRSYTTISNPPTRHKVDAVSISSSQTMTGADSGKVYFLAGADGGTITLPAPEAGYNFKFVMTENNPTTAFTIDAGSGLLFGNLQNAAGFSRANNDQNVVFGTTSVRGDVADLVSDGTYWYVFAVTPISGAITFS